MEQANADQPQDEAQQREMKQRFDDYVACAIRIFERLLAEAKTVPEPPLTVPTRSITMKGERSNKPTAENIG